MREGEKNIKTEERKKDRGRAIVKAFIGYDQAIHIILENPDGSYEIGYFYKPATGSMKDQGNRFRTANDAAEHLKRTRTVQEVTVQSVTGTDRQDSIGIRSLKNCRKNKTAAKFRRIYDDVTHPIRYLKKRK